MLPPACMTALTPDVTRPAPTQTPTGAPPLVMNHRVAKFLRPQAKNNTS
jgi:hypothetical protein